MFQTKKYGNDFIILSECAFIYKGKAEIKSQETS